MLVSLVPFAPQVSAVGTTVFSDGVGAQSAASPGVSGAADPYVVMFHCVAGCVQNLNQFGRTANNVQMTWGVNESSFGGYVGGLAYNPQCSSCNPYTGNGYEFPFAGYDTYITQPLGVYSSKPYVTIQSVQFTVAYPGVGNHIFTQGQYPLTLEVDVYSVSGSVSNKILTSNPSGKPIETSYITIYPTVSSCGRFTAPSNAMISSGSSTISSYTVRPGDSLYSIGLFFGIPWQSIAHANNIQAPYTIHPGEVLTIPTNGIICYAVQSGDYLYRIGQMFSIPWQSIAYVNKISSPYSIFAGETLVLLTSTTTYTVRPGDYLYKIGQAFGVQWQTIATLNGIVSPYTIYVGEVLVIP